MNQMIWTLGPAGPPRQRGVLVVPQSAQLFKLLSSNENLSRVFLLMSSNSDPCIHIIIIKFRLKKKKIITVCVCSRAHTHTHI